MPAYLWMRTNLIKFHQMKRYMTLIFMLLSLSALAQNTDTLKISLQQAQALALKNRFDIHANQYDIDIANNNIVKTRNEWLPDLSAGGTIRYNTQLQATLIPTGFAGSNQPQLLALGSKNTTIFDLELDQPIFKPNLTTDIKIARNDVATQQERNRAYEIEIKTQVNYSYLNVQLKALQLKIMIDNQNRYQDYYTVATATFKAGALLENDLLKAKLDYQNAQTESEKERQQYELSLKKLSYQLNISSSLNLVLTDTIVADKQILMQAAGPSRTEIRLLQLQQEDIKLQKQKIRQSNLPVVSLFANYSQQFLNDNFNYSTTKMWSPFSYLGLKLNVPISLIFKNKANLEEFKLKDKQTALLLEQKNADINYEIQNATTTLSNAAKNMQTAKSNYDLSRLIYNTQKQQYKFGALLYRHLLDTEKSLSTAEQNYVKTVYDYLLAKTDYLRANGSL